MLSIIKSWSLVTASWLLCVTIVVVGYLTFIDGSDVVVYERHKFPVSQKIYTPGEVVVARVEAYKSRDLIGQVQWSLVNHKITYFAKRPLPLPHGVVDAWMPIETLPDCASGVYHMEGTVTYRVNPLREVTYRVRTEEFEIVNNRRMP